MIPKLNYNVLYCLHHNTIKPASVHTSRLNLCVLEMFCWSLRSQACHLSPGQL